jgi:hypothetical protein
MLVVTIRKSIWFGIFLLPVGACSTAKSVEPISEVTVSVYNDARVPVNALESAETIAFRIFREGGLNVKWMNCAGPGKQGPTASCNKIAFPAHLHVRILTRARTPSDSTFGISYLSEDGIGCYSDVFLEPMARLHVRTGQEVGTVLGHVMAHEIAHLLLGTNSHSAEGIMRAQWQKEELISATKGELLFTARQAQAMRQRLSSVTRQTVGD